MESDARKALESVERIGKRSWTLHNELTLVKREINNFDSRIGDLEQRDALIRRKIAALGQKLESAQVAGIQKDPDQAPGLVTGSLDRKDKEARAAVQEYWPTVGVKYLPLPENEFHDTQTGTVHYQLDLRRPKKSLPFGLHVGSVKSRKEAQLFWRNLKKKNSRLLSRIAGRFVNDRKDGRSAIKVIVGPFRSNEQAEKVCKVLRAKKLLCDRSRFEGQAL